MTVCLDVTYLRSLPGHRSWLPVSTPNEVARSTVCAPAHLSPSVLQGRQLHHAYADSSVNRACPLLPASATCRLAHNTSYCAVVRAINQHGLPGERVRSTGVRICSQPPVAGIVWEQDGDSPALLDFIGEVRDITCAWRGFSDACSLGIETYSTYLQRLELNGSWTPLLSRVVGTHTTWAERSVRFFVYEDSEFRCAVCGTAASGLTSCAYSDGVTLDTSPPSRGSVCLGTGDMEVCDASGPAHLSVAPSRISMATTIHWHGFDDPQSGVASFLFAVGSSRGGSDLIPWSDIGWATSSILPKESLPAGSVRVVSIKYTMVMRVSRYVIVSVVSSVSLVGDSYREHESRVHASRVLGAV